MAVTAQRISEAYKSKGKNDLTDVEIADLANQLSSVSWGGVNDSKSTNSIKTLLTGGNTGLGSQMQGYVTSLMGRVSKYHGDYLTAEEKKLQAINPSLKISSFYNPVAETYNWGEGASGNRNRVILDPWLKISEQSKALKAAQAAAQEYQKTGKVNSYDPTAYFQKLYAGAPKSLVDQVMRGLKGNLSSAEKEMANAAAARVGATLPFKDAKIGNVAEGGAITNETLASGVSYDKQAQNVLQGKAPVVSAQKVASGLQKTPQRLDGAAQSLIDKLNSGLNDAGQPLNAQQRSNLEMQFKAMTGLDTVPLSNGGPLRSNYADGKAGDKQFMDAVAAYNAKLKKDTGKLPSSILDAENPSDATEILNQMAEQAFGDGGEGVPTRGTNTNAEIQNAESYFTNVLSGNGGASGGQVTASSPAPGAAPFSAEAKLAQLRDQYDIDPMEQDIADLDAEIRAIQDVFTQNKFNEKGKAVNLGVMAGRISEEEQQANDRLNQLNRNKAYMVDQLKTKYDVVNTIMNAAQMDYKNAKDAYDSAFNQKIQATNLLLNIDESQKSAEDKARDNARVNVQIVTEALSNGALQWDSLDTVTKAQYTKLEMQAGLPTGTIQAFSAQAKNSAWQVNQILPGTDDTGNSIATILQVNKQTGEFKTTKLVTDYAPASKSAKSDVVQQGTYVDDEGNEVAWTKYSDGTIDQDKLGKAKQSTSEMSQGEKEQNDFYKYVAELVSKMGQKNSLNQPVLNATSAVKVLKARYPWLSDADARAELGV